MKGHTLHSSLAYSTQTLHSPQPLLTLSSFSQSFPLLHKQTPSPFLYKIKPRLHSSSSKPSIKSSINPFENGKNQRKPQKFLFSPSPSPERSPSPPPPPSPLNPNLNTDPFSCSPPKSRTTSAPVKTYSRNLKSRKAKSTETLKKPTRKPMRLSAKKKSDDVMFIDLDLDEGCPIKSLKKTPTDAEKNTDKVEEIKKEFKDAVQKKKSLKECSASQTRNMHIPLHDPSLNRIFKSKWASRPIGVGRMYDFGKLLKEGIDLLKFVEPLGWKDLFQIKETRYP